jgi:hypothetical protein
MTRFETAFVSAALALIGVGCNDSAPRSATRVDDVVMVATEERTSAPARGPASGQKHPKAEAFVIIGASDEPRAVTPEVKQGKGKGPTTKSGRQSRPAEPPKPVEPTFTVAGGFLETKEKAKESAIQAAVEKLHLYLLDQHPQVTQMPKTEMVREMLVPHPGAAEEDARFGKVTTEQIPSSEGQPETLYKVEIALKVRPEHVRELRARERSSEALWVLAGLGGLAAVLAVFFRIDAWTKGYLTSWLVLGTVGAATLLGGMWWFAR